MSAVHLCLDDLWHERRVRDLLRDGEPVVHATALVIRPAIEAAGEDNMPHTRQIATRALRLLDLPALQAWDLDPWPGRTVLSVATIAGTSLGACRYLVEPEGQVHAAPDAWTVLSDQHACRLPENDDWWHDIFEPLAAELEAGWQDEVARLLARYAVPPGAWWAIRLDWTIDPVRLGAAADVVPRDHH